MMYAQKKIKIVIGLPGFGVGGIEHHVLNQLRRFNRELFQIYLVTLFDSRFLLAHKPNLYADVPEWVTVYKLDFAHGMDASQWRKLYVLLTHIRPDVVMTSMFSANAIFRLLQPFFGYRCIVREHNTYYDRKFYHKIVDYLLSFLTYKVVAVSSGVKKYIVDNTKVSPKKIAVIYNSVNIEEIGSFREEHKDTKEDLRQKLGFTSTEKIVLHVGRLKEQKNQKLLIDAFALFRVNNPEYTLALVGDGSERKKLESYTRHAGLLHAVHFFGQRDDVYDFYMVSEFFVLTSRIEGFAIVGIEAMAFGLPVVSTRVAGPDEYVHDGENGYLTDAVPEAVSQKMLDLATLLETGRDQVRKNCENTASMFSLHNNVRAYEQLFLSAYTNTP